MESGDVREADALLASSVWAGDEAGLTAALQRGADPRQLVTREQVEGGTLLALAAAGDRHQLVQPLVAAGVAVDCRGTGTHTPLHLAAHLGNLQVAAALIEAGADVQTATSCSRKLPPVHLAGEAGHVALVRLLLGAGADIEAPDYQGFGPLHNACYAGQEEVVQVLLEAGANKEACDSRGWKPIHRAALFGFPACVTRLVEAGADVEATGKDRIKALHLAATRGHIVVLDELEKLGCDVHALTGGGSTAVLSAASGGRLKTIQWLAMRGVSLVQQNYRGNTPEQVAHFYGYHDVAWWLYKQRLDPPPHQHDRMMFTLKEYERLGEIALEWIQPGEAISINILHLMARPFRLHFQDSNGWTPLHHAAHDNNEESLRTLLSAGAFPQAVTHRQQTPADLARLAGHTKVAELLQPNNTKLSRTRRVELYGQLLHAVSSSELQVLGDSSEEALQDKWNASVKEVSQLLSAGAPLEPLGPHTALPLHLAVSSNCVHLLPLLLSAGAPLTTSAADVTLLQLAWLSPDVTTYVAVVITRAFAHKLRQELREVEEAESQEAADLELRTGMESLHTALTGSQPWTASWGASDDGSHDTDEINDQQEVNRGHLNEMLERASQWGLSLTASFLVHGGANLTALTTSGRTPLHAALDARQSGTAHVLLRHLRANPFQNDVHGRRPLDLFPGLDRQEVLEDMISQDYRTLSYLMSKARTHQEREEAAHVLLLLAVLFSHADFCNPSTNSQGSSVSLPSDGRWQATFLQLKTSLKQCSQDDFLTNTWLKCALSELREDTFTGHEDADNDTVSDEEELFSLLVEELSSKKLKDDWQTVKPQGTAEDITLTRALMVCCQSSVPLLAHLVLTVGGVSVDHVVEEVSGATPLHVAASHGRFNFCNYLCSHQASTAVVDSAGRTPAHLAFMFGHSDVGNLLSNGLHHVQDKAGKCPHDLLAAFKNYILVYHLDSTVTIRPHEKNDPNTLIHVHLRKLQHRCKGDIGKAVQDLHVDFTNGEAQEVKKVVTLELERIVHQVGKINPLMAGDLQLLGSSADNLRLYAPDEYDCNVILRNISGFPGGGLHFELTTLPSQEAQMKGYSTSVCATESTKIINDLGEGANIVNTFFNTTYKCVKSFATSDHRLSFVFPGIRRTQVGANLSFAWEGSEFLLFLIDVDLVPVVSLPWPQQLHRPQLTPKDVSIVHLTNTVHGDWRFSFAAVENQIFRSLTKDQRLVFLACKLLILSLKVESWAPQDLKAYYTFWDGRNFKIPAPPGFILKCAFLQELEEVTQETLWQRSHLHTRMVSVFKRMCISDTSDASGETKYYHSKTKPYFGGECEKAAVGLSAPKILTFLESWKLSQY